MKKYLFSGLVMLLLLISGCVTYKDGEPVKDEAYEESQKKNAEKEAKEKKAAEKKKKEEEKAAAELNKKLVAVKINNSYISPASIFGKGATWAKSFKYESIKKAIDG